MNAVDLEAGQLNLLLVEDDDLDAESSRRALGRTDHDAAIEHVPDLISALESLNSRPYDCVLLDLGLPDARGLSACDAITSHPSNTPVVVLTGDDDTSTAMEAMRRGAQDYLVKGSSGSEIYRAVQFAVARAVSDMRCAELRDRLREIETAADERRAFDGLTGDISEPQGISAVLADLEDALGRATFMIEDLRRASTAPQG